MTLGQKQRRFTQAVGLLIAYAYARGYELTLGDAHRDKRAYGPFGSNTTTKGGEAAYGHRHSLHKVRLAIDFNLFIDGEYMEMTSDHEPLGEYWEKVIAARVGLPLCWGGRFNDGNHYSCEHEGMK